MAQLVTFGTDLFFSAKIRETAKQAGVEVESVRDPAALAGAAKAAKLVILDLRNPAAMTALDNLAADPSLAGVRRVGFVDHERLEVFDQARQKGCEAMAKGAFTNALASLVEGAR